MTDFKAGDKVVVTRADHDVNITKGKEYTVRELSDGDLHIISDRGFYFNIFSDQVTLAPAPVPDADGWYPMPKLKAGDPIPEWLVDPETEYRSKLQWPLKPISVYVSIGRFLDGTITHYRPAPKAEIATTPDGKEYRITHNPDGSVKAEVV